MNVPQISLLKPKLHTWAETMRTAMDLSIFQFIMAPLSLYETYDEFRNSEARRQQRDQVVYGRYGTPLSFALENAIAELEGANGAITVSSGLAAITESLKALVSQGDHILVTDSVYQPTRKYCNQVLARFGVEVSYYDPLIGSDIKDLIKQNTSVIFVESPGSQTFEIQDLPAIAEVAKENGITTILDNTWATPLYLKPFDLGIDVSVHAATKYITGHSDAMLGIISTNEACYDRIRDSVRLERTVRRTRPDFSRTTGIKNDADSTETALEIRYQSC